MADETTQQATKSTAPKTVQMPRTVHQLHTGPKPEQVIEPETIITDDVAKQHKLTEKGIEALVTSGAIELVDVLKA